MLVSLKADAYMLRIYWIKTAVNCGIIFIIQLISTQVQKGAFCGRQNMSKCVIGRGSAPDPAEGAHDAPRDPLVGWDGTLVPILHPTPRAFGTSILPPSALATRRRRLGAFDASVWDGGHCPPSQYFPLEPCLLDRLM